MKRKALDQTARVVLRDCGLDPEKLCGCELYCFDAGEAIYTQGRPVERLYLVLRGKIKVCMLAENGRDLTLCYTITDGLLGDVELMREERVATATSVAVFPSVLVSIPISGNEQDPTGNLAFMTCVAKGLAAKLVRRGNEHIASALYSGRARLCAYILTAEHEGLFCDVLSDAAKSIGVSYRHLFRILNELCDKGVLQREASGFRILDRAYLKRESAR